jgi:hypothetical protein
LANKIDSLLGMEATFSGLLKLPTATTEWTQCNFKERGNDH